MLAFSTGYKDTVQSSPSDTPHFPPGWVTDRQEAHWEGAEAPCPPTDRSVPPLTVCVSELPKTSPIFLQIPLLDQRQLKLFLAKLTLYHSASLRSTAPGVLSARAHSHPQIPQIIVVNCNYNKAHWLHSQGSAENAGCLEGQIPLLCQGAIQRNKSAIIPN